MKLTLDKQALELLFDNDPEMKLEFKNAAVNYASKHFLKEVTPGIIREQMRANAKMIMEEEVGKLVKSKIYNLSDVFELSEKAKQKIKLECELKTHAKAKEILDSLDIHKIVSDIIDRKLVETLNYNIERGVKKRLQKVLNEVAKTEGIDNES